MSRLLPVLALVGIGALWGATQPLAKVAVSTGHAPLGLMFWQALLGAALLGGLCVLRGQAVPLHRAALRVYVVIALVGSVLPGIASYAAAVHLPSGILSILLSSVPMWAFPIALALGNDRFVWRRLAGLGLGFAGVLVIVLPGAQMSGMVPAFWVGIALLSSLCYAAEGNIVQRWGTAGLGPVQVLAGASVVAAVISGPLAALRGEFIAPAWGAAEQALVASACLHAVAYSGYVWLVGRAGSVFTVQVSYFVTVFGVIWAMLFLSEAYAGAIWAALALMLGGMALVQPRPSGLVPGLRARQDGAT